MSEKASPAAVRRGLFASLAVVVALVPATALSQQPAVPGGEAPPKPAAKDKPAKPAGKAKPKGEQGPPKIDASAWVLIDPRDDAVLAASAPDKRLPIASATKLMTARLALEELNPKRKLSAVPYQALAAESLLGTRAGEKLTVRDLLYALVLPSANDAAATLADGVSGSVPRFVNRMNREAAALGLDDTSYANPIGLDSPQNYSSAADLAELAEVLLKDQLFARIADTQSTTLRSGDRPRQISSRNTLLGRDASVDGVKTGHTRGAGYVLVASATREGTRLISVVLGAGSEAARDSESLELLEYGFSQYKASRPVSKGEELADPELDYRDERLPLIAKRQVEISVRRGQAVDTRVEAPDEVSGAVARGETLGRVVVTVDGKAAAGSPLIASEAVEAATQLDKVLAAAENPTILLPAGAFVILVGTLIAIWARRPRQSEDTEPPPEPKKSRRLRRERGPQERSPEERRQMHEERMRRRRERQGDEE